MKWDVRFLRLAREASTWSKDPGLKVGAIIADHRHRVVGCGYNGFPPGIKDDERLQDRPTKLDIILHAEDNAIAYSYTTDLRNCSIYVWGIPPCAQCASKIIRAGITRVISTPNTKEAWQDQCTLAHGMFTEASVRTFTIEKSTV